MTTKPLGTPLVVMRATDGLIIGVHPLGPSHCVTGFPAEALLSKAVMCEPSEVRELLKRFSIWSFEQEDAALNWTVEEFLKQEGIE